MKEPQHQNENGRESGSVRGPAGLPQVAAEVPKEYFSGQRVFPRSAHQTTAPDLEKALNNIWV